MNDGYLTFMTFSDPEMANSVAEQLEQQNILCVIENNNQVFDPSFANNRMHADIYLKLRSEDFTRAHAALEKFYSQQLNDVDSNYYLFDFSDDELMEIVTKPDEWGYFDYQLARKILRQRNIDVTPEVATLLKTQRINELARTESISRYWVFTGYGFALLGGLFGLIIGGTLAFLKKTLPNGERTYVYEASTRKHGVRMLVIAAFCFAVFIVLRLQSGGFIFPWFLMILGLPGN